DSGRRQSIEEPGTVIDQLPRPGDPIPQDRVVAYWLAERGPGLGEGVPSIIGRSAGDANAILGQNRLRGRDSGRRQSIEEPGTVMVGRAPRRETIHQDRVVAYWLAKRGPGPGEGGPSIIGRSAGGGKAILGQKRLRRRDRR